MKAKALMVQGTASSVGKSLLVTAFCRLFKRQGFKVAPFKAQNMSLNSYVTVEGGEMGRAQVAQAEAAGVQPSVLMNPVLLKPSSDKKSQVIVNGKVRETMTAKEYYDWKVNLIPEVFLAFSTLSNQYDIVVIEGAGSPAEINLLENDFVNMGMADFANAPVILVGDIDRGGVFASLYGTVKLLPKKDQQRIKGMIINKFRGEKSILDPGLDLIEKKLNIPVLGVLPYSRFFIDEEDSLTERLQGMTKQAELKIAVIRLPRMSNFSDFSIFDMFPEISLTYVDVPTKLEDAHIVIIPGSKNTIEDMRYMHTSGFTPAILEHAKKGKTVIGICGGYQMLGMQIEDPYGLESNLSFSEGLGLLPIETILLPNKRIRQVIVDLSECPGVISGTKGMSISGYEIHMGVTSILPEKRDSVCVMMSTIEQDCLGVTNLEGNVFGTYVHGLFDNIGFTRELVKNIRGIQLSKDEVTIRKIKEKEYDRLADMLCNYVDMEKIKQIMSL